MNKSVAVAKLDFLTIKPYMKIRTLILLLIVAFIMSLTGNVGSMVGIIMVYGAIFATYPFSIGDKNGIDMLYSTLSLKRSSVVAGRYVFSIFLNLVIAVFAFACSFVVSAVMKTDFILQETLFSILVCFIIFTAVLAFQLPIYFKLGYTKAKFIAYLPLIVFPVGVAFISSLISDELPAKFFTSMAEWVMANSEILLVAAIVVWALIFVISYKLSYHFYNKREF